MNRVVMFGLLTLAVSTASCGGTSEGSSTATMLSEAGSRDEMATFSPDDSKIAFWRISERGTDLWVANSDMSDPRATAVWSTFQEQPILWTADSRGVVVLGEMRGTPDLAMLDIESDSVTWLTNSRRAELLTQMHPDGSGVVYGAGGGGGFGSYVAAFDGSGSRDLLTTVDGPWFGVVSPDGSRVSISLRGAGNQSTVWVANVDGSELTQLTTEGFEFIPPIMGGYAWSPDSRELTYLSNRTGRADIWVVSVEDGESRQMTHDLGDDFFPSWSPDGRAIAFLSDRGRQRDLWLVPAAGGTAIRVTDDLMEEEHIRWRSDGSLGYSVGSSPGAIWIRSIADGSETRLTPDSLDAGFFSVSPDRSMVAFAVDLAGGDRDIAVMPTAGGDVRLLTGGGDNDVLTWDPSGTRLGFRSDRGGNDDVYVVPVDGSTPATALIDWPSDDDIVGWSPDGKTLYFTSDHEAETPDLWIVPADGSGEPEQITTTGFVGYANIAWDDPDGPMLMESFNPRPDSPRLMWRSQDGELTPTNFELEMTQGPGGVRLSRSGEMVAFSASTADGNGLHVFLSAGGQPIASVGGGAYPIQFNDDQTKLLYGFNATGGAEVGVLDIASGEATRLTETPVSESHARFSADPGSIILRRVRITQQVMTADVSGLLAASPED